ncbi:MAG: phosphoribosylamine--glycine ligase [Acidobacteriota bacterium]|jgi:phosphoribosylamine--glycine ligase
MDVLVVGGGGREHALVWALSNSDTVNQVYCAPGNAGIGMLAERWDIAASNIDALTNAALDNAVDLVVVGPEAPLTAGLADRLRTEGVACFGPSSRAAVIEGSKAFAKAFMTRHNIPTAPFRTFDDQDSALAFVADCPWGYPVVIKADGLAAGKGVLICGDAGEAATAIRACMEEAAFGRAGKRIVVEAFLDGIEATCMALCDGEQALPLLVSQDHKPAFDGDQGPNTGGMGAYAPAQHLIDNDTTDRVLHEILQPTVEGMAAEDRTFSGVLYAGLMLTPEGPKVLEFNCRFGDPEAQVVLPLLAEDFGERLDAIAHGDGVGDAVRWSGKHAACVVLAAPGYPGKSPTGMQISGLDEAGDIDDVVVFHAATAQENSHLVTAGGRVLGVTGLGESLDAALAKAYQAVEQINFEGMHYRSDIGRRGVKTK